MNNNATYFKWSIILIIAIAVFWLLYQVGCINTGSKGSTNDTVKHTIDTVYVKTSDTVLLDNPVPYKVVYWKNKVLHDTLEDIQFITTEVDSARILDQYFASRFYDTIINVQYGSARLKDTVTQNRITGRSVLLNQNIPVVKETTVLTQPKRVILYVGIQAMGNLQNLPFASGVTLDLKFKNDVLFGVGGYITRDQGMYSGSLKFPIKLRKK